MWTYLSKIFRTNIKNAENNWQIDKITVVLSELKKINERLFVLFVSYTCVQCSMNGCMCMNAADWKTLGGAILKTCFFPFIKLVFYLLTLLFNC